MRTGWKVENALSVFCFVFCVSWDEQFLCQGDNFRHCRKRGQGIKWVPLHRNGGQVAVITVKEVSQKECRPPHSHLHYLSTCQSICLPHSAHKTDKLHLQRKHVSHVLCNEEKQHPKCDTLIGNSSIVQHFSSVSNYYSCSRNKEFQSILSKLSRRQSSDWQLNHAAITFASHFD